MIEESKKKRGISSFSVLLIMVVLMVIGLSVSSLISLQYSPSITQKSISISYTWPQASARIIEQEVTSKIEGVLASVTGVDELVSSTYMGGGYITLYFKKDRNIEAARFEVATMIRQIHGMLPEDVSYPSLSSSVSAQNTSSILTYTLNSPLPSNKIEKYANENIINELSRVKGVNSIDLSGTAPFLWEVSYDYSMAKALSITPTDIREAISNAISLNQVIGTAKESDNTNITISIRGGMYDNLTSTVFDDIIVKKVNDRVVRLGDVATAVYKEKKPDSYYRINGLNTINIAIYPEKGVNTLEVIKNVKTRMNEIESSFSKDFSIMIASDTSEYINAELDKIWFRTILSLIILLSFVYITSRSLRYLLIIAITLTANVLIAFIFYYILSIELHIYSLAGITVSLGVMIDTSIIMSHHYSYYHNRKAFIAILGALLTTIGSLIIVFFLPDAQKASLVDFSIVIIINLTISLFIALLFIPALLDKIPLKVKKSKYTMRRRRIISKVSRAYKIFILFGRRHKGWVITLAVLMFGLPIFMLPSSLKEGNELKTDFFSNIYNKTLGSSLYNDKIKPIADVALGGTLRLFVNGVREHGGYREPERVTLNINAAMPEGCSVHQLNDVMKMMENYLSGFDEIDMFTTRVSNYNSGRITVTFKKEFENGPFPHMLKNMAISKAINYGGATWSVYGVNKESFNNNIFSGFKSNAITITGYNYDKLYAYAELLVDSLKNNRRVSGIGIYSNRYGSLPKTEYYVNYDREKVALKNINMSKYFGYLSDQLYEGGVTSVYDNNGMTNIVLKSSEKENFDIWHIRNNMIEVDSTLIKFDDFGTIEKRLSGNDIHKVNQEYSLNVAFDFVGTSQLAQKVTKRHVTHFTDNVLPLGYKITSGNDYYWNVDDEKQYLLLGLIIVIIYFICAILFESLRHPLIIIMLIPISFVGLFLLFYVGDFHFDQGGFAAFVLLSGIVVNAGIYLINEYNGLKKRYIGRKSIDVYMMAYNHKIVPILLTIISTVLGLLPFLYDGEQEVFWFSFAIGSIGGIMFSIVALIIYLPILMPLRDVKNR